MILFWYPNNFSQQVLWGPVRSLYAVIGLILSDPGDQDFLPYRDQKIPWIQEVTNKIKQLLKIIEEFDGLPRNSDHVQKASEACVTKKNYKQFESDQQENVEMAWLNV